MFQYSDPSGSGLLSRFKAINEWRNLVESEYRSAAKQPDSAFTWIDALLALPEEDRRSAVIPWKAFPIRVNKPEEQIDEDRALQEEYVEWAVFRDHQNRIDQIVFTTEFREYFGVLAGVSPAGITHAIESMNPGSSPTNREIYGVPTLAGFSRREREALFLRNLADNPWNNGAKGILALTTRVNSIPALFGLAAFCGVEKDGLPAEDVCSVANGACVPGRQSDPQICTACQKTVRNENAFSLIDPIGIFIDRLEGNWSVGGQQIDINDDAANYGRWQVTRNKRRAVLKVGGQEPLFLDDDEIESGAQVANKLFVAATVMIARDDALPEWARTGKEELQRPIGRI